MTDAKKHHRGERHERNQDNIKPEQHHRGKIHEENQDYTKLDRSSFHERYL